MKLIVGLGNPGKTYEHSRHNLGWMVVRALAEESGGSFKKKAALKSGISEIWLNDEAVLLALPLTFMNLSGIALKLIKENKKINLSDILVICDDISIPLGLIKIRAKGSSAGHNGLKSIIAELGTENFSRLRIGIKPQEPPEDLSSFVLSPFKKKETAKLNLALNSAVSCLKVWADEGIEAAMNKFN